MLSVLRYIELAGGRWVEEAGPVTRWQGDTSLLQTMLMILLRLQHNRAPDNQHYTPRSQGAQTNSKGGKTKSARKPRLRRRLGNFREQNSFSSGLMIVIKSVETGQCSGQIVLMTNSDSGLGQRRKVNLSWSVCCSNVPTHQSVHCRVSHSYWPRYLETVG